MKSVLAAVVLFFSAHAYAESVTIQLDTTDAVGNVMYLMKDFGLPANGCVDTTKALKFDSVKALVDDARESVRFDIPGNKFASAVNHPNGPQSYNEIKAALVRNKKLDQPFALTVHCQYHFCVKDSTWYNPQGQTKCNLYLDL
jgi:hypothetical protein